MATITIYPSGIKGTTGHNTSTQTQELINPSRACNGTTSLASWGHYTPTHCNSSNPIRWWCDALTTKSGSFDTPEVINTTGWNISGIDDDCEITSIKVEYAYALARYTMAHGGVNCGRASITQKPKISLRQGKTGNATTVIANGTGVLPPHVENMKSGALTNQTLKFSSHPKTIKDLKNTHLRFEAGKNVGSEFARLLLQYIRIVVTYEDVKPKYTLSLSTDTSWTKKNTEYKYTAKVTNSKPNNQDTICYITVPNGTTVKGLTKHKNNIYKKKITSAGSFNFYLSHDSVGTKTISAYLAQYSTSKPSHSVTIKSPVSSFEFEPVIVSQSDNSPKSGLEFYEEEAKIKFRLKFHRDIYLNNSSTELINIDSNGLIQEWTVNNNALNQGNGKWTFNNISKSDNAKIPNDGYLESNFVNLNEAGTYTISAIYYNNETNQTIKHSHTIKIKSVPLKKEFFKLKLEDGTDVQYNALTFTKGDDLATPLTYETEDYTPIHAEDFIIIGETKKIPVGEAEYISFNVQLKKAHTEFDNVLAYIEAVVEDDDGRDCSEIISGINDNGVLLESNNNDNKYCLIKHLSSDKPTELKLIVQSDVEQNATIKIKPYNYNEYYPNGEWMPCKAVFKDLPNIKMYIDGTKNDIASNEAFTLNYCISNKSNVDGKNLKYKIKEPYDFEVLSYSDVEKDYGNDVSFNPTSRILSFKKINADNKEYILSISYRAKKKGIYDFSIETLDNKNTIEDDQHKNSYTYKVMVDIADDIDVHTHVNNNQPEVNQLIDYVITVTNRFKHQKSLSFDIADIGDYNPEHHNMHYTIEHVKTDAGEFKKNNEIENAPNNIIGQWTIDDIPVNGTYHLRLSIRPTQKGLHTIRTVFTNTNNEQEVYTNKVNVLEHKKDLSFNVYHAVNDDDIDCSEIDNNLIPICDNDYINLSDSIYYVIEITNNNKLELKQPINIYARLPHSFLENAYCSAPNNFIHDENTGLLNYQIQSIPGCQTTTVYLKAKPSETGKFTSNFMAATQTANVFHKALHLTVDTEFNQRELEHEIKIYNFEKTNKYYRYEIDNQGEIFKFFNTGDKTLRPIETESYNKNSIETYVGSNLKEIARDIKKHSKYVDPVFLRTGSNKLKDKGYELFPDGLIRRFGLLKSEVFHYTNQLPITSDLVEKAMRWNVDEWNTKIWAGGDYDNGVFDLTIDYDKIPTNFDIRDATSAIKNLQAIVDKTKPYGTKGRCYYSTTTELKFGLNIEDVHAQIQNNIKILLALKDIYLLTTFNRQDGSIVYHHDAIKLDANLAYKIKSKYASLKLEEDKVSTGIKAGVNNVCVYESNMKKEYIEDILSILKNLYNKNNNTNNIDIVIPYQNRTSSTINLPFINGYQSFNYTNNHTKNKITGLQIQKDGNIVEFGYIEKDNFKGFVLKLNDKTINKRLIYEDVSNFSVMSQEAMDDDDIIHFWASTNKKEYYHIGFITFTEKYASDITNVLTVQSNALSYPSINYLNEGESQVNYIQWVNDIKNRIPISFKISDKLKEKVVNYNFITEQESNKWHNLDNINTNNNYAHISYTSNECDEKPIKVPTLTAKYNNIGLNRLDEVTNIDFKITAQSNKENLAEDININLLQDGDYHYPDNNISRKIYYPQSITNTERTMLSKYIIDQPNITICNECLKTSLGLFDECPHCQSENISHYNQVQPVTICSACGWVTNGTHSYCHHCLSKDVENTEVDYNKTYCNNCTHIFDDYYKHCPNCFSSDTIYLDNKKNAYILEKDTQNIEPITIKTQNVEEDINIFNIEIPFGQNGANSDLLKELKKFVLHIDCTNNNNGTYYYCDDCKVAGLGHYDICPKCGSTHVINKEIRSNTFEAYLNNNAAISRIDLENNNILEKNKFTKSIDLLSLSNQIKRDSYVLQFYVSNPYINDNINDVLSLSIDEKYTDEIINVINNFDFTIDNIRVEYEFIEENNKWTGLTDLVNENHKGIQYKVDNESVSEKLIFNDFNIPQGQYQHAYLYVAGICKSMHNYDMHIEITDSNYKTYTKTIYNNNPLFNNEIDLVDILGNNIHNVKLSINFEGANIDNIVITDCNILVEQEQSYTRNKIMTDVHISHEKEGDLITLKSNDMWGLKKQQEPYYIMSGRSLESNLLSYIDFGQLHSDEYIRIYNIDMIVYYQSKIGKITTESIPVYNDRLEQLITGTINKNDGEIWGFIQEDKEALNNLEYESVHIDEKNNLSNSIPLYKMIAQSFEYAQSDISKINLEYFGKKGYPSEIISVSLYDDYNNTPNNLIAETQVTMPNKKEIINIDFDINELNEGRVYWIVIEDTNANENNYHRFNYNSNKNIGTLMIDNKVITKQSLCFSIDYPYKTPYYDLPINWTIIHDSEEIEFRNTIESSFYCNEEMDSLILKVLRTYGEPNSEVQYVICDDNEDAIIGPQTINLPIYQGNVNIDISALEKNKEYYIKIIPNGLNYENYFVLYYDEQNDNILANNNVATEYDITKTDKDELKEIKENEYDTEYKMANIFYRYNIKSSNVYLSGIIIRNGYNMEC